MARLSDERWKAASPYLDEALDLASAERAAWLAALQGRDPALAADVRTLLEEHDSLSRSGFLETGDATLEGKTLGHYLILSRLGSGGMGDVYLAEDLRLVRKVALKLLPPAFTHHPGRAARFEKEARAVSALNHPNVVTVYEIGRVGDRQYIASELVEGVTLRRRLASEMTLAEALDVTLQVTSALAASHRAGVVHRDIKPENVMLRPDGYVKVLDFGLATLASGAETADEGPAAAGEEFHTAAGVVLGTPGYMSPEQLRGERVDARADIFSLGVVLDEMIAPLRQRGPEVPVALERIAARMRAKPREARYASATELMADLRAVSLDLAVPSRRFPRRAAAVLAAAAAVAAAGLALVRRQPADEIRAGSLEMRNLTMNGAVGTFAISRDGRLIAYSVRGSGQESLWLREVAAESHHQIVPPAPVRYQGLSFSSDGAHFHFLRADGPTLLSLHRMPVRGGEATKLMDDLGDHTLSPDETQVAYVRHDHRSGRSLLLAARLDGSGQRTLASRPLSEPIRGPAWSPDGTVVAFSTGTAEVPGAHIRILAVGVEDGVERPLSPHAWEWVGTMAWLHDSSGLVLVGRIKAPAIQIWHLSRAGGEARRITRDPNNYRGLGITADSRTLITARSSLVSELWLAPDGEASRARRVLSGHTQPAWLPDGRLVYAADVTGDRDLWIMNGDGTGATQLTSQAGLDSDPAPSADGRYVVFVSDRGGGRNVWRMDADGRHAVQLTSGGGESQPVVSPDGQWVVYVAVRDWRLWKVPLLGGEPRQVTRAYARSPAISPDGRWIAYLTRKEGADPPWTIAVIPFDGGEPARTLTLSPTAPLPQAFQWSPDGQAFLYVDSPEGVSNLWRLPVDGGPARQVTHFQSEEILGFAWSPDGKVLACARGRWRGDVVLISGLR